MKGKQNLTFLLLSLPLVCIMVMTSIISLKSPDFYSRETANWAVQSLGQDMIDLYLVAPIGGLMVLMQQKGLEASMAVATAMGFLAFFSLILLILYILEMKKKGPDPSSTPSLQ